MGRAPGADSSQVYEKPGSAGRFRRIKNEQKALDLDAGPAADFRLHGALPKD
jgi:hypothetical protein